MISIFKNDQNLYISFLKFILFDFAIILTTSVIAAVGYRAEDDVYSKMIKVRRPKEELFIHV